MRVNFLMWATCSAMLLGGAANARAEQSKNDGRFPMTLRLGSEMITGEVNRVQITKVDAGVGLALDAIPRLTLYVDMLVGVMHIGIDSSLDNGLAGTADIWSHADLSARTGASVRMFERRRWRFDIFAEYESSLIGLEPKITTLRIDNADGAFDISPFGADNVLPELFWNRFSAGMKFTAEFGRFSPSISVAYQLLSAELDIRLTDKGRETMQLLGYDDSAVERRHLLGFWSVPIVPGIEYRISQHFSFGIEGTFMPAGDSIMYGGGISGRYRL